MALNNFIGVFILETLFLICFLFGMRMGSGAILIINFVCFHYALHARMYVINVCFRRSPR